MITIFRRIRQQLLGEGKGRRYLVYAIGEIALVMIGILLALQVNNWNQNRMDKREANDFGMRLLDDIYEEKAIIDASINYQTRVLSYAERAINVFENGALSEEDTGSRFLIDLYQGSQILNPNPAISTYQELISSGKIGMIDNDSLRSSIITYYNYDWTNAEIISGTTPYRESVRKVIPNAIQSKIRENCGDTYVKVRNSLEVVLPEQCDLSFDEQLMNKTVEEILKNESLKSDLRFQIGTIEGRMKLLNSYSVVLEDIVQRMEKLN